MQGNPTQIKKTTPTTKTMSPEDGLTEKKKISQENTSPSGIIRELNTLGTLKLSDRL